MGSLPFYDDTEVCTDHRPDRRPDLDPLAKLARIPAVSPT
jgi:hypothetical protein